MTVKEYLNDLQKTGNKALAEEMQSVVSIWNNESCKGYCITAMKATGHSKEQISEVLEALSAAFDEITVEEAEQIKNT